MAVRRRPKPPEPPKWNLPKGYLSASAVEAYLACPYSFYLHYVEGKDSLTSPPLIEGGVLHGVLEASNHRWVDTKEHLPEKELHEKWDDEFSAEKGKVEDWGDDKEDLIRERARAFLSRYMGYYATGITPEGHGDIESKVEGTIHGVPMLGFIDVVSNFYRDDPEIVDYKVVKSAKTEGEAENSIQLGVYAHLKGLRRVKYVCFTKTKEPQVKAVSAERTERSIERAGNVVRSVAEAVSKGNFPFADPCSWKCSMRYCGVFYACPQGGKK